MVHYLLQRRDTVQFRHLYVHKYCSVANITASFRHVFVVHIDSYESVDRLITLFAKLSFNDPLQRYQVERLIVHKQNFGLAAAHLSLPKHYFFVLKLATITLYVAPVLRLVIKRHLKVNFVVRL